MMTVREVEGNDPSTLVFRELEGPCLISLKSNCFS
jgi:hypothetical protein